MTRFADRMNWRRGLPLVMLALLTAISGPAFATESRPNVLIIMTDDMRWDAMSCAGSRIIQTPQLDRVASEGTRFANMFCTTSLCSPSRASLLSGLYAHRHGVVNNFTEYPNELPSYPRQLQAAGYETGYIGKWHMGENNDSPRPGFDYFVTHKGQGKYFDNEFNFHGERKILEGYYTHRVTDLAVDWLAKPRTKPFLLVVGHKAPHSYYEAEPKYAHAFDKVDFPYPATAFQLDSKPAWVKERTLTWHGIYGPLFEYRKNFPDTSPAGVKEFAAMLRGYYSTILSVDDSVGRLYETLQKLGVLDNTILVFLGDNGLFLGEHGLVDKRSMHEASIRIPLIMRHPKLIPAGKVVNEQILTLDFAPSLLDLCGAAPLPKVHGQSFKKLLAGDNTGWRTGWYYEYNYEKQFPYTPNIRGIRTDEWKYIIYPHGDGSERHKAELYHLKVDPEETKNLADDPQYAAKKAELRKQLFELIRAADGEPDVMPLDAGVINVLPD